MTEILLTEALAELKTIPKRIESKRDTIRTHMIRQDHLKDPLEKDGSSQAQAVRTAFQSIDDLTKRMIKLRTAINEKNLDVDLTIEGMTYSIAEWITWKREIVPILAPIFRGTIQRLSELHTSPYGKDEGNYIINVNEEQLRKVAEKLDSVIGQLDGKLSVLNATTTIILED